MLQRKGLYPVPPGASDIPGLEVAGTIVDGDREAIAAAGLSVGARVCALVAGGGYAEYCVAPVGQCLPSPANFSDVEAASLPETFFTVWSNVFDRGRLQPGETLARARRLERHRRHRDPDGQGVGCDRARRRSARPTRRRRAAPSAPITRSTTRPRTSSPRSLRLTGGKGVDVILDMVAGEYIGRDVKCLAEDGRIVIIAVQGGTQSTVDAGLVLRRRLTISGSTLRPRPVAFKAAIAAALRKTAWPWLESGKVKPVIHQVFPAVDAARAHELMESNRHIGKLVLAW